MAQEQNKGLSPLAYTVARRALIKALKRDASSDLDDTQIMFKATRRIKELEAELVEERRIADEVFTNMLQQMREAYEARITKLERDLDEAKGNTEYWHAMYLGGENA
jgi:predicted S18 family serine protease